MIFRRRSEARFALLPQGLWASYRHRVRPRELVAAVDRQPGKNGAYWCIDRSPGR